MQYAVLLYFDEKSKNAIKNRISKIDVENYDIGLPPHITLFSWYGESVDNYIEQIKVFASSQPKIDMTFSSFGVFDTMGKHIFLSPVRSDDFSLLQSRRIGQQHAPRWRWPGPQPAVSGSGITAHEILARIHRRPSVSNLPAAPRRLRRPRNLHL